MKKYFALLLIPVVAFTLASPAGNLPEDKKCTDCHSDFFEWKVIHQAIRTSCASCHKPTGSPHPEAGTKGFTLTREQPDLCYACHSPLNVKSSVHSPVSNGKCMICHEVHSSDYPSLLKMEPVGAQCLECHTDLGLDENKSNHKPVTDNRCQDCHDPHQSDQPKLLVSSGQELCLKCHPAAREEMNKKSVHAPFANKCAACHKPHGSGNDHLLTEKSPELCIACHDESSDELSMTHVHPPFRNKCSICHTAHASDEDNLLKNNALALCIACHDDFEEPLQQASVIHKPLTDSRSCMNCHAPHASAAPKLLTEKQSTQCLGCHNRTIRSAGKTRSNMKLMLQQAKFIHGAIDSAGCSSCHNPHFSENRLLLLAAFPVGTYVQGTKDTFALCFNCHNPELLTEKNSVTATNFRAGDKNLHFVHLSGKKGRNCTVCHDVHVSQQEHLLVDKIPFGDWTMKMVWTGKENGGSCQTACHAVLGYTRQ